MNCSFCALNKKLLSTGVCINDVLLVCSLTHSRLESGFTDLDGRMLTKLLGSVERKHEQGKAT